MSTVFEITQISTQETLGLRQKVLKPFLPEAECVNPGDELSSTYHFGLWAEGQLISIATFIAEAHPDFIAKKPYRLRGMATAKEFQGRGWGRQILRHGLKFLEENQCDFLWCNARIKAFSFYEKLDLTYYGPLFELNQIGPHKVMYKRLNPS